MGAFAKQVVRYAWGRREAKLTWCASKSKSPFNPGEFGTWADSSWADVKPSRRSTSCHYIMCNNALVYWRSTVASVLATSTTEAELISAASCAQDVAFYRKFANELGFVQTKPTILLEDNKGCLSLVTTVAGANISRFDFSSFLITSIVEFWNCVIFQPRISSLILEPKLTLDLNCNV